MKTKHFYDMVDLSPEDFKSENISFEIALNHVEWYTLCMRVQGKLLEIGTLSHYYDTALGRSSCGFYGDLSTSSAPTAIYFRTAFDLCQAYLNGDILLRIAHAVTTMTHRVLDGTLAVGAIE